MTIEEVNATLGKPTDNTASESNGIKIEMVSYDARGDLGANILVMFENGAMSTKTHTGVAEQANKAPPGVFFIEFIRKVGAPCPI